MRHDDTELGGRKIAAGDRVALWYLSANRDESVFETLGNSTSCGTTAIRSPGAAAARTTAWAPTSPSSNCAPCSPNCSNDSPRPLRRRTYLRVFAVRLQHRTSALRMGLTIYKNRDLSGKVVVITGSARGYRAATARAFAAEGAKVVISDIDAQALAEAAESDQTRSWHCPSTSPTGRRLTPSATASSPRSARSMFW